MFLRSTNRKKDGKDHRYFSIVENRRLPGGKTLQRTVLYLGEINDQQQAGWRKTLEVWVLHDAVLTTRSEGHLTRPWGVFGGKPGASGSIRLNPGTPEEVALAPKKSNIPLKAGDIVSLRTPGAGGYGDPGLREPGLIEADVLDEMVTGASQKL